METPIHKEMSNRKVLAFLARGFFAVLMLFILFPIFVMLACNGPWFRWLNALTCLLLGLVYARSCLKK